MRYTVVENPVAVGILKPGATVSVKILSLETGALLSLAATTAPESPAMGGVYTFSLANIQDAIDGFTQVVVEFTDTVTGDKDYSKLILRGYVDDVRRTKILVAATL